MISRLVTLTDRGAPFVSPASLVIKTLYTRGYGGWRLLLTAVDGKMAFFSVCSQPPQKQNRRAVRPTPKAPQAPQAARSVAAGGQHADEVGGLV